MMENHDWSTIQASPLCPYINTVLLPRSSYCDQYYNPPGLHPSLPNYLWLVAGTNFGIRDDNPPSVNHQSSTNTLFHQLDLAGITWKAYQENITGRSVPDTDDYPYAVRHNPFVFFDAVRTNLAYCTNHVRPFTEFARDLGNHTVPRFSFISPNLTNDMHDRVAGCASCSSRTQGDAWLSREVPGILASAAFTNGGALFIAFDEGSGASDGPIGMIVLSPRAKGGGYHSSLVYDHSSTLRTFQDLFGVGPYLGGAAAVADLSDLFKTVQISAPTWSLSSMGFLATNLIPGHTNYVQVCTEPANGTWVAVQTNVASGTSQAFTHVPAGGVRAWFYRVVELP
jgi:phosphatidylinositol-3-phosphatase